MKPRSYQYELVHRALPIFAFKWSIACLGGLTSHFAEFIEELLRRVDEVCRPEGIECTLKPSDIRLFKTSIFDFPCAIIQMPEPQEVTEAYFVGVVFLVPISSLPLAPDVKEIPLRYFVLEKTGDWFADDQPPRKELPRKAEQDVCIHGSETGAENHLKEKSLARNMFCEWTKDGVHHNYGGGPPPALDSFMELIANRISENNPDPGVPQTPTNQSH